MARHFSHLSQVQIRQIISAFNEGEPKLHIARRFGIDHSTVHYHVSKFEQAYPQTDIYPLVAFEPQKVCIHPSLKCAVCGQHKDAMHREERKHIRDLTAQVVPVVCKAQIELIGHLRRRLAIAHQRLEAAGLPVE